MLFLHFVLQSVKIAYFPRSIVPLAHRKYSAIAIEKIIPHDNMSSLKETLLTTHQI